MATKKARKTIRVTPSEVSAAKSLLKLDAALGRSSDPAIKLIANARRVPARSQ